MSRSIAVALLVCVAAAITSPSSASAQRGLPTGGAGPSLRLEVAKPFVDNLGVFSGVSVATTVWDLALVVPLAGKPTLFARLGLSYASIEGLDPSMTISKPRLGAMFGGEGAIRAEAHVDLPFVREFGSDDYATGIAFFTGYEELERFLPDTWSIGASATAENETNTGTFAGARLGGTLLVPTGSSADTDLYAVYAIFGHVPAGSSRVRLELSGLALVTQPGLDFSDRTAFFAALEVLRPDSRFAPEFFVRAPVDEGIHGAITLVVGARAHLGG
jgi:hypothetical protein